ncbi:MAG: hypothetical protein H7Y38_18160 [Armatimonadetes bacterium]|nr:hypothetical protein [Armatimonadota bacterium]
MTSKPLSANRFLLLSASALALLGGATFPAHAQTPTSNVYAFTDLHAQAVAANSSLGNSQGDGISGDFAVGAGQNLSLAGGVPFRAVRWNLLTGTATNLHSQIAASGISIGGTVSSRAVATSNGAAVGYANPLGSSQETALLWNADNTVTNLQSVLTSSGVQRNDSRAVAIADGFSVGSGTVSLSSGVPRRAVRWNLTNSTAVSLHTQIAASGITLGSGAVSDAFGTANGRSVGYGGDLAQNLALLWNANNTVTNLHTQLAGSGITLDGSVASAIANDTAVGYGFGTSVTGMPRLRALRWNLADNTATNLHTQITTSGLNLGTGISSAATGTAGGVSVGYASGSSTPGNVALLWRTDDTALNLQSFVTNGGTTSQANALDAATGIIAGTSGDHAVLWTPLNAGVGGANALVVRSGATTTINQTFTQNAGAATINGVLSMGSNLFILAGGTLGGDGTIIGDIVNTGGTIAPGNSPGTLSVGNFSQSGGVYEIEIAGTGAGQFDVLNVATTANFTGGAFSLSYLSGYTPTVGDFFDVVTTGIGLAGTENVAVPVGWTFALSTANSFSGRLSFVGAAVVPEAGTWSLLAIGLSLGAAGAARRRK